MDRTAPVPLREERRRPPRARGAPLIGTAIPMLRDPPGHLVRCARTLGDVCDIGLPGRPQILVSHPDAIEEVLVTRHRDFIKDQGTKALSAVLGNGLLTSDGDFWKRQRRLAAPAFHRERVRAYGEVMVAYTERGFAGLRDGDRRDLHRELMRVTLEIVAKTLFDADAGGDAKEVGDAIEVIVRHFETVLPGVTDFIDRLPLPKNRRFRRAMERLDELERRIIEERRARGHDAGDLLSMLMAARDDDGSAMSDRQIRDEALTLLLAGHETTALALSWAFYLLGTHDGAERRLHEELDQVLAGRAPTVDDLPALPFTEAVIKEAMRIYPPAWALGREPLVDWSTGGYDVPRGAQVWLSPFVAHRDARWFDEPERFLPERWLGDLHKSLPKYAYFPFGGGPRMCIGNSFAMMEATLLCATIARRLRFRLVPGHPIAFAASITLRPKHGVLVDVERRS